jgi:hypothetical protein
MNFSPVADTITAEVEQDYLDTLNVSSRYQLQHPRRSNVLQAKFSPDSQLIAISFIDGSL